MAHIADAALAPVKSHFDRELARGVNKIGEAARGLVDINVPVELDGLTSYADCFRNIDDILIDRLQGLIFDYLQVIVNNIFSWIATWPIIQGIEAQLGRVLQGINRIAGVVNRIAGVPVVQFAIRMYNAKSDAERIAIAAEFTGARAVIDGILSRIPGLASICGISTIPGIPPIGKIDYAPIPPAPPLEPPMILNKILDTTIGLYTDTMAAVREALSKETIPADGAHNSMMTTLHYISLVYHDQISYGNSDAASNFRAAVEYNSRSQLAKWGAAGVREFQRRAAAVESAMNERAILDFYNQQKNRDPINAIANLRITVYGPADIDPTTFLDIKPDQRPPGLTEYWDARLRGGIAGQEANGAARGIKYGTLDWENQFTGAYGDRLLSGYDVASTRYPGGTILDVRYTDGSPVVVDGNTSGEYRVADTGWIGTEETGPNSGTWGSLDFYVDNPNAYNQLKVDSGRDIVVRVLELGNKTGGTNSGFNRANNKWNSARQSAEQVLGPGGWTDV